MALAEAFNEQARKLLYMASRCPSPEMAEAMRGMAAAFLELARNEAEVCVDCSQPCIMGEEPSEG
jgi:hypothetical protein